MLKYLKEHHTRISSQDATRFQKFGMCFEHPKKENEYYDRNRNKAFCNICAIKIAQERQEGQKNLVSLEDAYNIAKKRASNENKDPALDQRKQIIKNQMD